MSDDDRREYYNLLRKFYLTTSESKEYWLDDDNNIVLLFYDESIARSSPLAFLAREGDRIRYSIKNSMVTLLRDPKSDVYYFDEDDELIFLMATSGNDPDDK